MRLLALAAGAAATLACTPRVERVLLVSIDTLRADHVGAWGAQQAHTPTLDALAASGVRFETAISPVPLTLPSHTSLMTGLDPPEHGVRHNSIFRLEASIPTLAEQMRGAGFQTAAFVGAFVLASEFGLARGFDHYDDTTRSPAAGSLSYPERSANEVVDAVLAWLDGASDNFFLWVHFYDPHADYEAPPGFAASFRHPYDGEIAFADSELARLLASVEERWSDDRTLIVVTSDHGESLGAHGEATHSHLLYETTQHVPLLMRGPGLPAGAVVSRVVALKDVGPTVLALARAPALPGASGRDLRPLVRGEDFGPRPAYLETLATQLDWNWSPLLGLRGDRYKYIRAPRPELYDLERDPRELHNLAPAQPRRVAELDETLETLLGSPRSAPAYRAPSAEERVRLESLGYVVPDPSLLSRPLGAVGGPDPKDEIGLVAAVMQANRLLARGEPEAALRQLESLDGEHLIAHLLRATAALKVGRTELAEASARRAIAASPRHPAGYLRLASTFEARGRLEEARAAWQEALRLGPGHGAALVALARLEERLGELERSADLYRRALRASNLDRTAAWRLAALELERGRSEEAEALLAGLPEDVLASPEAALRIARAEQAAGRPAVALARLEAASRAHPESLSLRLAWSDLLAQGERPADARAAREAALAAADRALGSDAPGRAPILYYRAELLSRLGRAPEARASLEEALGASRPLQGPVRADAVALAKRLGAPRDRADR